MFDYEINSRPILQAVCGLFLLSLLIPVVRRRVVAWVSAFDRPGEGRGILRVVGGIAVVFFLLAFVCKYSQLKSHLFAGADFWLIEDLLNWMAKGQPYLTRFAGQDIGPVQHGAIHAFLSMYLLVPLVWIFGSEFVAVVMNPLALALGGFAIGWMAFKWTGSRIFSVVLTVAFLGSAWTGRILMYDCHPESFYPLLIVAVAACLDNSFLKSGFRWVLMIAAVTLLAGMKQDAIILGGLLWLNAVVVRKLNWRAAVVSFSVIILVSALMTGTIREFRFGAFGSSTVAIGGVSADVVTPVSGSVALGGYQLNSVSDLRGVASQFLLKHGGAGKLVSDTLLYPLKPPFLLICLIAPWVWFGFSFWILLIPLGLVYGLIGGYMAGLPIYHSAPALGLLFVVIIMDWQKNPGRSVGRRYGILLWLLAISAFHGSSGLFFYKPSEYSRSLSVEARARIGEVKGLGVVSSRLLGDIDHERVWSDRPYLPGGRELPASVGWVMYPRENESFDFKNSRFEDWKNRSLESGAWKLLPGKTVDLLVRSEVGNL